MDSTVDSRLDSTLLWSGFLDSAVHFRSKSFSKGRAPASELVLQRRGLLSEIALQGGSLESKIVLRGVGSDFEKPKLYFRQQRPDNEPLPDPPGCKVLTQPMKYGESSNLITNRFQVWLRANYFADCCLVKTIQLLNMLACKSGYYCALNRELLCRLIGTNQ